MTAPPPYVPVVTRLPEALKAEAEAIAKAAAVQHAAEVRREVSETDAERLARESS